MLPKSLFRIRRQLSPSQGFPAGQGLLCFGVLLVTLFSSGSAMARCGDGTRHMIWRYASASELIEWDGRTASITPDPVASTMSEDHFSKKCSQCQCPRHDQARIPVDSVIRDSSPIPVVISASPKLSVVCLVPRDRRIVWDESFLGCCLGVLERPPCIS
jgi:hypothetical protein